MVCSHNIRCHEDLNLDRKVQGENTGWYLQEHPPLRLVGGACWVDHKAREADNHPANEHFCNSASAADRCAIKQIGCIRAPAGGVPCVSVLAQDSRTALSHNSMTSA